jgi:hypothetical protein
MVSLPNEIIYAINHEYRQPVGYTSFVSLAAINRNWQTVVDYTWRYLRIIPQDCGRFHSTLRGKSRRRRAIKTLDIRFESYFVKEDQKGKTQDTRDEESTDTESSNQPEDALQPGENLQRWRLPSYE